MYETYIVVTFGKIVTEGELSNHVWYNQHMFDANGCFSKSINNAMCLFTENDGDDDLCDIREPPSLMPGIPFTNMVLSMDR